ncbi:MAG: efflux RND transporter periplasmic adaptor subunit [Planctomycetaceae bacterium]
MRRTVPSRRNPSRSRAWLFAGWLSLAAAGCGGTASAPTASKQDAPRPVMEAAVLTVELRQWPTIVRSQGSVVADEVAVVGSKVAGRVSAVHVDLGDLVREGEPLATLDQSEFRLQVAQTKAQLAQARSAVGLAEGEPVDQLDPRDSPPVQQEQALWDEALSNAARAKRLRAQNAITQSEHEQVLAAARVAEARHAAALNAVHEKIALIGVREAELALARERLENAVVPAPFDGLVQHRPIAPGSYIQVGDAIATVVRSDMLRFRGTVPERHAQGLAVGQKVVLRIESVREPRTVRVTRISPSLDLRSRSLLFEAAVPNPDRGLRTGLFAEAEVVIDPDAQALVVPSSAMVEFAGAEKVWILVDGVSAEREVLIGRRRGDAIEILEGLSAGDLILHEGSRGMVATIKPLPVPAAAEPADIAVRGTDREREAADTKEVAGGNGSE